MFNTCSQNRQIETVESSRTGKHTLYKDIVSGRYYLDSETLAITLDQWQRLFKDC